MKAFDKIVSIIKRSPQYGHFVGNVKNKLSLLKAKNELEKMIEDSENKKGEML